MKKMNEGLLNYDSPTLTVFNVEVEQGYSLSGNAGSGDHNVWSTNPFGTAEVEESEENYNY